MSLRKFKKPDKNEHDLSPRRLLGHQRISQFSDYAYGWDDYYWNDYYYYDYYEDERDEAFVVPVYDEWVSKRNGRASKERRMIGQYIPEEAWLGVDGRREKRIDDLLMDLDQPSYKNLLGDFMNTGRR